jgi:ATP-dependent RNA helicase RhlE
VPESYVHRIGRTARAGAEGIAISLCGSEERPLLRDIERLTRQTIPSTNRSGDAGLAAVGSDRGHGDGRAARSNGRPHAARPSGQRNGASNGHGHGHSHGHGGAPRNGASKGSRNGQRSGGAGDRHAGAGERHAGAGGGRGHTGSRGPGGGHASRSGASSAKR